MDAYKDAILAYAVYYPVVDFLLAIAIACVIWFGGQGDAEGVASSIAVEFSRTRWCRFMWLRRVARRAGRVHSVRAALFPPHHGLQREVQHPAVGDGVQRTHFQVAGHSGDIHVARRDKNTGRPRPHRVRPRLVRLSGDVRRKARQPIVGDGWGKPPSGSARPSFHRKRNPPAPDWVLRDVRPSPSNREKPSPSSATPAPARPLSSPAAAFL
jgi:hypothetical protein